MSGSRTEIGRWLHCIKDGNQARVRLFCFPYSGAGASIFYPWAGELLPFVELWPVQLPGRETRLAEPPFGQLIPLIDALEPQLRPYLDRPFALFGHSMGALVAFELARALRDRHNLLPVHLFVSGHGAPHLREYRTPIHGLPEAEFLAELRRLRGTPEAVLEHAELRDMIVPILRADFAVCETYLYRWARPLACPISALGGLADDMVNRDHLEAWHAHTSGPFSLHMFPGGHFYLQTSRPLLLQTILRHLSHVGI